MLGFSLMSGFIRNIIKECKSLVYAILNVMGPLFTGGK